MGIFKKKTVKPVPEECRGMEIKIMSSTCTGEKTIGFYNRNTREIMYPELVKRQHRLINRRCCFLFVVSDFEIYRPVVL